MTFTVKNPTERKVLDSLFDTYPVCEKCGEKMEKNEDWYNVNIITTISGGMIDMICPKCGHKHSESIQFDPQYMPTMFAALMQVKQAETGMELNGAASHMKVNKGASRNSNRPRNIQEAAMQRLQKRKGGK